MNLYRHQMLVRLTPEAGDVATAAAALCADTGATLLAAHPILRMATLGTTTGEADDGSMIQAVLAHPLVLDAEYDYEMQVLITALAVQGAAKNDLNDPRAFGTVGLWDAHVWDAWRWAAPRFAALLGARGDGKPWKGNPAIKVAVLDTGWPVGHPDLPTLDPALCYDVQTDTMGTANLGFIANGETDELEVQHGAMCSGVIHLQPDNGAGSIGIAPHTTPVAIRMCSSNASSGLIFTVAIEKAMALGANVFSFSWGQTQTGPTLYGSIAGAAARAAGGLFFQSAGNDNYRYDVQSASSAGVRFVGGSYHGSRVSYSNYGNAVWCVTPTEEFQGATTNSLYAGGTSAACPAAAGIAALVWSLNPAWTADEVEAILIAAGDKSSAMVTTSFPNSIGVLDAGRCVRQALSVLGIQPTLTGIEYEVGAPSWGGSGGYGNRIAVPVLTSSDVQFVFNAPKGRVWADATGGVVRVKLQVGPDTAYDGPPSWLATLTAPTTTNRYPPRLRAWKTGSVSPDLDVVLSNVNKLTPVGTWLNATTAQIGCGAPIDISDWYDAGQPLPYVTADNGATAEAYSIDNLGTISFGATVSNIPPGGCTVTADGASTFLINPANFDAVAYYTALDAAIAPVNLPGTLPGPGTLTSGQSASWAVQSAGGPFRFEIPATGDGVLEVRVDGAVRSRLAFGTIVTDDAIDAVTLDDTSTITTS